MMISQWPQQSDHPSQSAVLNLHYLQIIQPVSKQPIYRVKHMIQAYYATTISVAVSVYQTCFDKSLMLSFLDH